MSFNRAILTLLPFCILFLDLILGFLSSGPNLEIKLCLFLVVWMVTWWIFEVLPLGITALIPLFFLPTFQLFSIKDVSASYANPVIFLFLGGFIIARALEKTRLDERLALQILKKTGHSDSGIVLGFIISTAFLSMWISNTATTVMMIPIGFSVIQFLKQNLSEENQDSIKALSVSLFLSIAYSANIGGVMTPVGTPPNIVFMGYLDDLYDTRVDFFKWLIMTVPVGVILLTIMFYLLKKLFKYDVSIPKGFELFLKEKLIGLGRLNIRQKITISVGMVTAFLWIFKGAIHFIIGSSFLNDTSIAMFGAILLFLIPTSLKRFDPILKSEDINHLPWGIVLLFGGGMAMASSLEQVGLIQMAADNLKEVDFSHPFLLIGLIAAVTLTLTEIMSNVALCVVALPLIMSLGESYGVSPFVVAFPATLCASFAFSMPISTPPNAIVFGTQAITVKQMFRAGALLNAIAIVITMTVGYGLTQLLNL